MQMIFSGSGIGGRYLTSNSGYRWASGALPGTVPAVSAVFSVGAMSRQSTTSSSSTMPQLALPSGRTKLISFKVSVLPRSAALERGAGAFGQRAERLRRRDGRGQRVEIVRSLALRRALDPEQVRIVHHPAVLAQRAVVDGRIVRRQLVHLAHHGLGLGRACGG